MLENDIILFYFYVCVYEESLNRMGVWDIKDCCGVYYI